MDFLTGQRVIMDYEVYFNQKLCFWLKFQKKFLIFSLHKILCDGLGHVDYCDVFISCLDSHSEGTHSLHDPLRTTVLMFSNLF